MTPSEQTMRLVWAKICLLKKIIILCYLVGILNSLAYSVVSPQATSLGRRGTFIFIRRMRVLNKNFEKNSKRYQDHVFVGVA